ncbi:MAG TPA: extracellular solute-binding protein [Candidatus Limnocylindrales bacterium]|nr:extracellular solute-binding protein [Candidatus Limnocylindrales bacterium]
MIALLLITLLLSASPAAFAQDSKLVAEGKKEGKVVIYGSMETDIFEGIQQAFEKKTGIKVDYWRAAGATVLERASSERKANKVAYDLVLNNAGPMEILLAENALAKYDSPLAKNFPAEFVHPQLGPSYRTSIVGIIYNKSIISPDKAPKSLEDLLKPEYRGKLAFPDPSRGAVAIMWPISLYKLMGKERADKYLRDLAASKPVIVEGVLPAAERVTSGETPIAISYLKYVINFGLKGAPLDYVRQEKMLGHNHAIALSNKAVHPNAAKAFLDFFYSDDSLKIMARSGEFMTRKGIYPPLPDADKIQIVPMDEPDAATMAEKRKEYRKIFQ